MLFNENIENIVKGYLSLSSIFFLFYFFFTQGKGNIYVSCLLAQVNEESGD